jgi:hypothetical protein
MPVVGYTGTETCPGCGLVWEYDEGIRPTIKSVRALVAAERKRCAGIAWEKARQSREHDLRGFPNDAQAVAECIAEGIEEGGVST